MDMMNINFGSVIEPYQLAHNIGIAEYMRKRASSYGLNMDMCYVVGLLHNIGYLKGDKGHEKAGADLLEYMGMTNNDVLQAIKYHWTEPRNVELVYGEVISPLLVLTYEAVVSVDSYGNYIGFGGKVLEMSEKAMIDEGYTSELCKYERILSYVKHWLNTYNIEIPNKNTFRKESE